MNAGLDSYLIDTNVVIPLLRRSDPRSGAISTFITQVKQAGGRILVSIITVAEVEYGFYRRFGQQTSEGQASQERAAIEQFLLDHAPLPVDEHTAEPHARIRAELFRKFGTPTKKGKGIQEKVPEELRTAGKELGIDERDLLIAATAVQYNLILLTSDTEGGMARILDAATTLATQGVLTPLRVQKCP